MELDCIPNIIFDPRMKTSQMGFNQTVNLF